LTHDHIWGNLKDLAESSDGVLVAAADPHPELQEQVRSYGCENVYADYGELLESVRLDAVYIYADNRQGVDLAIQAVARGLHIMIEKPMASSLAGADRVRGAAHAAGVQLMVNWPIAWWPSLQYALRLTDEGKIGEIFQVNYRSAHAGPRELGCSAYFSEWLYDPQRNGGGALMDYCCYGAALACRLLGLPARVTAVSGRLRKQDLPAEDNAVLIMQHARAISTSTASWTQIGHMSSYIPMIYGSAGTLILQHGEVWLADAEHEDGVKLDVPAPAAGMRNSADFFLSHIRSGEPIAGLCGADVGLMAQEVLEAGLISAAEGRAVSLPLPLRNYQV
ncbi:MAG TPA: Gfo/Idh/MocA family oxidoreductase, partial [Roseiflexaceae bacterium]|nr:Gfo/Idh/MocA family oxidoreductase [Roseiflexaceae bacterium]